MKMRRVIPITLAIGLGLIVVGLPLGYRAMVSTKYRNFRVVEPGVLYRSGQMSAEGFQRMAQEYGFKTVISLRDLKDDGKQSPDTQEVVYCEANGIRHVILSPANWYGTEDKPAAVDKNLTKFLSIMDDPTTKPVLVHCFAGIHRTGGYVALYRMEHNGWTADDAIAEMKSMGTIRTTFDDEIPNYLQTYKPGRLRKKS